MRRNDASKWFGIASMVLALTIGAGCGGSAVTIPPASKAPPGVTFEGGAFGEGCSGDVYAAAGIGWAFCDRALWAYTTMDPGLDGYTELSTDMGTQPPDTSGGFGGGGGQQ
jgi:hypothetical protein